MLYLKSWLEDYIDLSGYSDQQIADLISLKSGEVEEFKTISDYFEGKVVVCRIKNLRPHPNADRLKIFEADLGEKSVQIVSAAENAREGLLCPVALEGAKLPFLTIGQRNMRGEISFGMCLGKSEILQETQFSSGLWELEHEFIKRGKEVILGQSICEVFLDLFPPETVFDVKYLQDKIGGLGNHLGLAMELAVCMEKESLLKDEVRILNSPEKFSAKFQEKIRKIEQSDNQINFQDKDNFSEAFFLFELNLNPQNQTDFTYTLSYDLQKRMFLTGRHLIGGSSDLSNYLLADMGQPSHFFSLKKLGADIEKGYKLDWEISKLEKQSNFKGLGQLKNAALPTGLEVLKQEEKILAIPGISGGESSKVEIDDSQIAVEVANFAAEKIARNSFAINYRSDSSRIWNSGVRISLILLWLLKFLNILEKQKTEFTLKVLLNYINSESKLFFGTKQNLNLNEKDSVQILKKSTGLFQFSEEILALEAGKFIKFDLDYFAARINQTETEKLKPAILEKLTKIGKVERDKFYPNVFYNHLKSPEDLLFEVVKLIGFENISPEYLNIYTNLDHYSPNFEALLKLKNSFVQFGYSEVMSRPLVSENELIPKISTKDAAESFKAISFYRQDENFLRDNLLTSLMKIAAANIQNGKKVIKIFEHSKFYNLQPNKELYEINSLEALAIDCEPYLLTSLIFSLAGKLNLKFEINPISSEKSGLGRGFSYKPKFDEEIDKENNRNFAKNDFQIELVEIKNSLKKQFSLPLDKKTWYLNIKFIPEDIAKINTYNRFFDESSYPKITRDYSAFVDQKTTWSQLYEIFSAHQIEGSLIDVKPVERGYFSGREVINFEINFTGINRTLTTEEIENWQTIVFSKIKTKFKDFELR